jgi:hypothetical protein
LCWQQTALDVQPLLVPSRAAIPARRHEVRVATRGFDWFAMIVPALAAPKISQRTGAYERHDAVT